MVLRPWSFLLIATRIPRAIYSFCRGRVLVLFTVGIPAAYSTPIYCTLVMTVIIYGKMSSWTAQLCLIYSSVHVVNTRLPSHQIIKSKRRRRSPRVSSSGCIKLLFNLCQIFTYITKKAMAEAIILNISIGIVPFLVSYSGHLYCIRNIQPLWAQQVKQLLPNLL